MPSSTRTHADIKTFTATAVALAAYVRVAIDSSGTVAVADATDDWHGITTHACAASGNVAVLLRNSEGTVQLTAGAAVSRGAKLFAISGGKVDDAQNGYPTGFIALEAATADGDVIEAVRYGAAGGGGCVDTLQFYVNLASITGAGDVISNFVLDRPGVVLRTQWNQMAPVTTAAKLATLNLEIGTTNLTGGTIALTSATCTPMGAVIAGAAITAANVFAAGDNISVEAASVTAFAEGTGIVSITVAYF